MMLRSVLSTLFLAFGVTQAGAASLADDPWPAAESDAGKGIEVAFASRSPFVLEDVGAGPKLDPPRRVSATLFLPDGASEARKVPAVVMLHGSSGVQRTRELAYGAQYAAMGVAALVVDSFGSRRDIATDYVDRLMSITETMLVTDAYSGLGFLASRADVDAARVALVGFSYGAMATVLAAYQQVATRVAPRGPRFAAHVSYYGPCLARFEDNRSTGAPVLMLAGERDVVIDQKRCGAVADDLKRGGAAVERIVYPGAYHQWDGEQGAPGSPVRRANNMAGCKFTVERDGVVRDDKSGAEMSNGFYRKVILALCNDSEGYLMERNPAVKEQSNRDVGRFLTGIFAGAVAKSSPNP
jgi:dienelactone hydrolase